MGIKNLYKFIEKYAPESISMKKITNYKNAIMGIDFNLMLYKLIYSLRKNGYDLKNNNIIVTHIHTLLLKLIKLKEYNITPVFVFDGNPPHIKNKEIIKRKNIWKKLSEKYKGAKTMEDKKKFYYMKSDITENELNDCKKLISIFGYQVIEALEEADAELAQLSRDNLIQYIVSDDMDILLFGGDILLKKFSVAKNKWIQEINLEILKETVGFTQKDLIKLGVLLGSDYCDNSQISINKAYKIIQNMEKNNIEKECAHAFKYFKHPKVKNIKKLDNIKSVNTLELQKYLKGFFFTDEYINKIINKINY